MTTKGYTPKIEDYRLLWMMLSQVIQNCGSSSCGVVSVFIITNMIYLVCIIYNTGFDSLEHYKLLNFHSIFAAVLVTIFWWVILMAYCEAGYKMTESVSTRTLFFFFFLILFFRVVLFCRVCKEFCIAYWRLKIITFCRTKTSYMFV